MATIARAVVRGRGLGVPRRRAAMATGAAVALLLGACVPYPMHRVATPVPANAWDTHWIPYMVVGGVDIPRYQGGEEGEGGTPEESLSYLVVDLEARFGIDGRSDLGVRLPSFSGLVFDYKRLLTRSSAESPPVAVAWNLGAGVVNYGLHGLFEAALVASGRLARDARARPYGALRVMQTVPLSAGAVSDDPTVGGVLGVRLALGALILAPELALYWDRSATGVRERDWLIIPSISLDPADLFPGRSSRRHRGPR